ncbi:hypothetical protein [Amycolatopsis pigmentata]|uniref:Uncharacterized protein n=1 Tax=Amycolatopsis pigmentata TaxID=450801 RepID=A0ABW5FWK0_9PSEU
MTWTDFYRRRDILDAVLREVRREPDGPLPFDSVPGARDTFGSEENLLLALHHKWTQVLSGHLRAETVGDPDHVDAVTRAWRRASESHPTLRAVLDAHVEGHPALRSLREAEQRMLVLTAGLADADEPEAETTATGAAFETLLRHGTDVRATRAPRSVRASTGFLRRMLAPSA